MKKILMIGLLITAFLALTPVDSKAQFTNFCNQTAVTLTVDTVSLDGHTIVKVTPVAGAESYTITVAMQSAVADTALYYNGVTQTSSNPAMVFFGLDNKVLYWTRATVCKPTTTTTNTKCCYVKTTAFTSQSKLAASNYPTWEQELNKTPRAAITGDGVYRKTKE